MFIKSNSLIGIFFKRHFNFDMYFSLADWTIKTHIKESLQNGGFTDAEKIIMASDMELRSCGSLSEQCIREARERAADVIVGPSQFQTVHSLVQSPSKCQWLRFSTGSKHLDRLLNGGISRRGITELAGAAGVGKTQLALQIAATTVHEGAGVIYISTEGPFPSQRLLNFLKKQEDSEKVFLSHCGDTIALMSALKRAEQFVYSKRVQMVILDSVAAVFRCEYESTDMVERAHALQLLGHRLHKFSNYGCSILCINQVTEGPENIGAVPCLGLSWSNLVTTRLIANRSPDGVRFLQVIYSPDLAPDSCRFEISAEGIKAQGDTEI